MLNKEMMGRLKTAAGYQKKAIRVLLPEGMEGHLDVIERASSVFDRLIIGAARCIEKCFKNWGRQYRIGGDEFVALLRGEDLERREELVAQLNKEIDKTRSNQNAWERLLIAKGVAVRSAGDATPDAVFIRADKAMYADKRRMKDADA